MRRNLLEAPCKIWHWVKDKITNVLVLLLNITASTKYHYWFALFLDTRYVTEIKDTKTFHHSENANTNKIVQKMMPKFYDYITPTELAVNTNTQNILVGKTKIPYTSITTLTAGTIFQMNKYFWRGLMPS